MKVEAKWNARLTDTGWWRAHTYHQQEHHAAYQEDHNHEESVSVEAGNPEWLSWRRLRRRHRAARIAIHATAGSIACLKLLLLLMLSTFERWFFGNWFELNSESYIVWNFKKYRARTKYSRDYSKKIVKTSVSKQKLQIMFQTNL